MFCYITSANSYAITLSGGETWAQRSIFTMYICNHNLTWNVTLFKLIVSICTFCKLMAEGILY